MSNAPKNPPVIRLPQAALVFIALAAAIGAMLIISNNMDPRAAVRAEFTLTPSVTFTPSITPTPVDPFAELTFAEWSSDDGLLKLEKPASWDATATPNNGPVAYVFTHPDSRDTGVLLAVLPTEQISSLAALPEDASPRDLLSALISQPDTEAFEDVTFGEYPAVAFQETRQITDAITGQPVDSHTLMWLVKLAPRHILVLQAISPETFWDKMQAAFDQMRETIELDVPGAIARLDEEFAPTATPTAEATAEATAGATAGATTEATGPATSEAASEATADSAPEATSAATPEPAATATPTPRS
ncbi:MAG: hypothetical protein IT323_02815 [Anaerolineae bacterium]|nr:hypothetical protein [Anaerolineae bacterium]